MKNDHSPDRPPAIVVNPGPVPRALVAGGEIVAEQRRLLSELAELRAKHDVLEARHRGIELDFQIWLGLVRDQARNLIGLIAEDPDAAREALDRLASSIEEHTGKATRQ